MFFKCNSEEEVNKLFKKISFHLHPDYGGDPYLMSLLMDSRKNKINLLRSEREGGHKAREESQGEYSKVYDNVDQDDFKTSIIDKIYEYAKAHPRFKTDFLDSVVDFMEEKGYITSSQYNSLVKTYYAFKMNEWKKCES